MTIASRIKVLEVVDAATFKKHRAQDVLHPKNIDANVLLRRKITDSRLKRKNLYYCGRCGSAVFISATGPEGGFHFKHFKGAPPTCEWYRGETRHPDEIGASIYEGRQESALHKGLKEEIARALSRDPEVGIGNVDVQSYVPGDPAGTLMFELSGVENR